MKHHGIHRGRMCARPCPGQAHTSGGLTVVMLRGQIVLLRIVLFLFLAASFAIAQGGPPYYTNDPGTPGNLNWEINFGYMPFLYSDQSVSYVPDVDINFGVGDRIQLTYENAWLRVKDSSSPAKFGLGQSNPGVKWRFHEGGESGLSISMFPQFFLNTGSALDRIHASSAASFPANWICTISAEAAVESRNNRRTKTDCCVQVRGCVLP